MRTLYFLLLAASVSFISASPNASMPGRPSSTVPPPLPTQEKKEAPKKTGIPRLIEKKPKPEGAIFAYPGIVAIRNDRWVGTDNFVNINKTIPIQISVVKPDNSTMPVAEALLQRRIENLFDKSGISVVLNPSAGKPPLPFFNLNILLYPLPEGYVAAIEGRLFEEVDIKRVVLPSDSFFQAITWEQVNLVVGTRQTFEGVLLNSIDSMINNFLTRLVSEQKMEGAQARDNSQQ